MAEDRIDFSNYSPFSGAYREQLDCIAAYVNALINIQSGEDVLVQMVPGEGLLIDFLGRDTNNSNGIEPVKLVMTDGEAGDSSTQCSFVYTIKTLDDTQELATNVSPIKPRSNIGEYIEAEYGIAYYGPDPNNDNEVGWVLLQAYEQPLFEECN